jgi:hypothetical protein
VYDAAAAAFRTIMEIVPNLMYVKRIRFVLYSGRDLEIHEKILNVKS